MKSQDCIKIAFLHGFLGSSQDWEGVVQHLPQFRCELLDYPFQVPQNAVLVGYSMGGRIALRYPNPKIVISGHPGLQIQEEKMKRWQDDQQWALRFEQEPLEKVLKEWYDQPLFQSLRGSSSFEEVFARRQKIDGKAAAKILRQESLAHQIATNPSNTLFLYGAYDQKFANLYHSRKLPCQEIPGVGHAAHLEDPQALAEAILAALLRLEC